MNTTTSKTKVMAQGSVKKTAVPNPGKAGKTSRQQKRGAISKPKKSKTTADRLQKKYTSGLIGKTEKMLGERAGHLELIGKSKKTDKSGETKQKGGTRKFG